MWLHFFENCFFEFPSKHLLYWVCLVIPEFDLSMFKAFRLMNNQRNEFNAGSVKFKQTFKNIAAIARIYSGINWAVATFLQ